MSLKARKSAINKNSLPLAQRVLHFIREHTLVSYGQKLLVAVSGGPDSVCLLHILVELRDELGISLHVAHLDHQLRGAESEADAGYVADMARRLGIPADVERRDVKAYQARQRISPEEAAREVRYAFLAQVAKTVGAAQVAVGHTTDDNVETILMHLIRGTGIRGLQGLQPVSRWQSQGDTLTVVRPLLSVSRQETADYCELHRLMPRTDTSNLSLSPLRNRIRHRFLPLLESYNPRVAEALLRTARIADDALAFIDGESTRLWGEVVREQGNTIILDKKGFLASPSALQRHLLRMSVEKLLGNLKDIETRHIEGMMTALTKPAGRRINLPGGLVFSVEYDRYLLGPDPAALSPFPALENEVSLKIPGETLLPGWCVKADIVERSRMPGKIDGFTAYFDLGKTGYELLVRPRRPGDRFQPLGMSQTKKLGEFMIDARIPSAWRQHIPVVCSPQHILWVVGWRIDNRVRVSDTTLQVLRLKFEPR
jgi:tRNA(Ile)-lysidine synthase